METETTKVEVRIRKFADDINLFMLEECKTHKYTAQETFAAVVLLKELLRQTIKKSSGAAVLKKFEQSIQLVVYDDAKEC